MSDEWLLNRIDLLLDDWDDGAPMPSIGSLRTLRRFLTAHEPAAPSIGAHAIDGRLSASWGGGEARLTLYFGDDGMVSGAASCRRGDGAWSVDLIEARLPDVAVSDLPPYVGAVLRPARLAA